MLLSGPVQIAIDSPQHTPQHVLMATGRFRFPLGHPELRKSGTSPPSFPQSCLPAWLQVELVRDLCRFHFGLAEAWPQWVEQMMVVVGMVGVMTNYSHQILQGLHLSKQRVLGGPGTSTASRS